MIGYFLGQFYRLAPVWMWGVLALPLMLWAAAEKRRDAALAMFLYFLAVACDVPSGSAVFFGDRAPEWQGALLWLGSSVTLALPWALLWTPDKGFIKVYARMMLALSLDIVPPLGLWGWGSPLLAAGLWFPGFGFGGVLLLPAVMAGLATFKGARRVGLFVTACFCLYIGALMPVPWSEYRDKWMGHDTQFGREASGTSGIFDSSYRSLKLFPQLLELDKEYIVTPENIAGYWIPEVESTWALLGERLAEKGDTIVVGAEEYRSDLSYDNTIRFFGADGGHVYRQRVPVPVSMWRPGGGEFYANAYWGDDGLLRLGDGKTVACLICYEMYLAFPVMWSFLNAPVDLVLGASNQWWSGRTFLPWIATKSIEAWSRLYGTPYVLAMNT